MTIKSLALIFILFWSTIMSRGSYDHFKFVQQWPPAFCATNRCKPGAKQMLMFTIHGLWPDNKTYVPCRALLPLFAGRQELIASFGKKNGTNTEDVPRRRTTKDNISSGHTTCGWKRT
uniref:ribonuclease S-1-like n=1 Tax=Fragaria vesca subsp. vesca TaxID=101020 RepID=UPI0005CA12F5|nr:PREDICTED: ribonuclease S-1-like [Fragaria vesca subsp. vesca]